MNKKILFKYKFYERSQDGLLKDPPTTGPYYDQDTSLRESFDTEQEAKQAILNLKEEDMWIASDLILVQEVEVV